MPKSRKHPEDHNHAIALLQVSLQNGGGKGSQALKAFQGVLERELWRERVDPETGHVSHFSTFIEFVQAPPPVGLGTDFQTLWHFCSDHPALLDLLDKSVKRPPGNHSKSKNATDKLEETQSAIGVRHPSGNSRQAGLRRLRKEAPELHAKVLSGELSVHSAMVEAGFRLKQITVSAEIEKAADALEKLFDYDNKQIEKLIDALQQRLQKSKANT